MNGIYGWLAEASGEQKRALLAAFLGYMLDSMDVMLYALVTWLWKGVGAIRIYLRERGIQPRSR